MKCKKMISILLAAVLCVSILAGCGENPEARNSADGYIVALKELETTHKGETYEYKFIEEKKVDDLYYVTYTTPDPDNLNGPNNVTLSFVFNSKNNDFIALKASSDNGYASTVISRIFLMAVGIDELFHFDTEQIRLFYQKYNHAQPPQLGDYKIFRGGSPNYRYVIYHKDFTNPQDL